MGLFTQLAGRIIKSMSLNEALQDMIALSKPGCGGSQYSDATAMAQYRSWVYVAASHNADAVSSAPLRVYATEQPKARTGKPVNDIRRKQLSKLAGKAINHAEELVDHPVNALLARPNSYDTTASFTFKLDLFLELSGDAYVLIERENGVPVALHVLYSQYITIQTDGRNQIIAYHYGTPRDGKFEYSYTPDQIIHMKFFDPNDQIYGISPLQAAFKSIGLINAMNTYEEALNLNMGLPAGVLKYRTKSIPVETRQDIEQRWHAKFAGVGKAGKVVVTDQDVDYTPLGVNPRDMNFLDGRKWSREEIMACFRVPMAMLLTEGVNRSNMEMAQANYHRWTVHPRQQLISQALTKGLTAGTLAEGKLVIAFDDTSPLDTETTLAKAKLLMDARAIKKNELRSMLRLEYDDLEDGDILVGDKV